MPSKKVTAEKASASSKGVSAKKGVMKPTKVAAAKLSLPCTKPNKPTAKKATKEATPKKSSTKKSQAAKKAEPKKASAKKVNGKPKASSPSKKGSASKKNTLPTIKPVAKRARGSKDNDRGKVVDLTAYHFEMVTHDGEGEYSEGGWPKGSFLGLKGTITFNHTKKEAVGKIEAVILDRRKLRHRDLFWSSCDDLSDELADMASTLFSLLTVLLSLLSRRTKASGAQVLMMAKCS